VRPDRRWLLVAAGAVVLVTVLVLALVAGGGDDGDSVATSATSSSEPADDATTLPSTTVATTAPPAAPTSAPAAVTATTAPRPAATTAPPRCPRPASGSDFAGFSAPEIVIENAGGSRRSCVLLAETARQQEQGLMHQDDLDGYDGMLFRFPSAEEQTFWMRNTRIPLSIAFFGGGGAFVSSADMEPCGDRDDCPTYSSGGAAKYALEVPKGGLPGLGATSGSRLTG
jgi:uncharacterized membrane protein (UPF0127 family)